MGEPGAQRGKQHAERRRREGLVRVSLWVPAEDKAQIQRLAEQLRAARNKQLPVERGDWVGHRYVNADPE